MKTIQRTSAFTNLLSVIHWGGARDFPCVHNRVLKLLWIVIRTVCISRGRNWRGKGEEILSIHMMTIDNVYRSPFIGKRPKVFYQLYAEINFLLKGGRDIFEHKYGYCWKPNPTCNGIKWKYAKSCVLIGCNPVLTEICYSIMFRKGKEQ